MGVDKIVKLVGVLVAIVVAFFPTFEYGGLIVTLLGIAGAWYIAEDDRSRFLIAAVALTFAQGGLAAIPTVGEWLTTALGGLNVLFLAAAATVIVLGTIDRVKP